jgi:hypothetical protein
VRQFFFPNAIAAKPGYETFAGIAPPAFAIRLGTRGDPRDRGREFARGNSTADQNDLSTSRRRAMRCSVAQRPEGSLPRTYFFSRDFPFTAEFKNDYLC